MNKMLFIEELEYLLQDIESEEKDEAIQYYRDYFEEAGEEREEQVLAELGSPEKIAAIIRVDLSGQMQEGGEFTDSGYQDERFKEPNYQMAERYELPEVMEPHEKSSKAEEKQPWTNRWVKLVLWGILILAASPVILGAGGAVLGVLAGIGGILLAFALIPGACAAGCLIGGVVIGVIGILQLAGSTLTGAFLIGNAFICLGLSFLFLALSVLFYGKFMPFLFRVITDGISGLIHRRKGGAV